jgi:hypothetical protein
MKFSQTVVKTLFLFALVLSVAACSGARKHTETYTSPSGGVMVLDNDYESCTRSCNAEYDRCNSTRAAESKVGRGSMTGIFGAQADCKASMKTCLARCKER